ncbi:hypothetical protein [Ruegeria sp. HKCCA5426]|uniref:hypothetical protein n=1 Tax=Ruegeria sp. HKCCA5426 TaxID=2682985 RepID=UPI0014886768|nr:hypothetical protein [Ruegeria sp. HKCCA5426]
MKDTDEKVGGEVREELEGEAEEVRDEADDDRAYLEEEVDEACIDLKQETGKDCDWSGCKSSPPFALSY